MSDRDHVIGLQDRLTNALRRVRELEAERRKLAIRLRREAGDVRRSAEAAADHGAAWHCIGYSDGMHAAANLVEAADAARGGDDG